MRLELENIGKLSKTDIELNGVTVIAGENNTGKSTVGKALYSIFNGFYNIVDKITNERKNSILNALRNVDSDSYGRSYFFAKELYTKIKESDFSVNDLVNIISEYYAERNVEIEDENDIKDVAEKIKNIQNITDQQLFTILLKRSFSSEFNNQLNNIYIDNKISIVQLTVKKKTVTIEFTDGEISDIKNDFSLNLNTEAVYVDDPFVIDNLNSPIFLSRAGGMNHRDKLRQKFRFDNIENNAVNEIIADEKLSNIYSKINGVCNGELVRDKYFWGYRAPNTTQNMDVKNISTGLKTFVIIKNLLQTGEIGEKSTLILDEPEIHLHPEWQILFAEIIVLLQKEFDMTILINTHSPYFLEALEVYSKKHSIDEKCKYYLAENTGDISIIKDVTDSPELIYKKLARPFQILENERFSND